MEKKKAKPKSFLNRVEEGIETGLHAAGLPGVKVKITRRKKRAKK